MFRSLAPLRCVIAAAALTLALTACAKIEPYEYVDEREKKGPGLFTGEEGEFVIFRR